MKKVLFKGCGTALVTPFNSDGVNFEELRKLINFQILEGADSLIICGTTGESATMSLEERKAVIDFSVKIANGRVPIIAGTGGNNTAESIKIITRNASERIAKYAFDYAVKHNRKKVHVTLHTITPAFIKILL